MDFHPLVIKGTYAGCEKYKEVALAGVAQGIECQPVNQRMAGSIPSQSTCLGCRAGCQ